MDALGGLLIGIEGFLAVKIEFSIVLVLKNSNKILKTLYCLDRNNHEKHYTLLSCTVNYANSLWKLIEI